MYHLNFNQLDVNSAEVVLNFDKGKIFAAVLGAAAGVAIARAATKSKTKSGGSRKKKSSRENVSYKPRFQSKPRLFPNNVFESSTQFSKGLKTYKDENGWLWE